MTALKSTYDPKEHTKFVKAVSGVSAKTPKNALAYLEKNVVDYLNKKVETSGGADKRMFEKSHNLVTSYIDGMKSGDVEVKQLKGLTRELIATQTAYEKMLAEAAAKKAAKEAAGQTPWSTKDIPVEDLVLHEKPMIDHGDGADKTFRKYAKFKKDIPRTLRKPYLAVRVPVLVTTNGIPDLGKLQKTGLCDDLLFGYPILKDQVLIGMNHEWLKENFSVKTKVSVRQDGVKDDKIDFVRAANQIIAEVKQRTGRAYILMEPVHGFDGPGVYWAWIASEGDLRRLNGTTGPATFSVSNWTLPFEQQMKNMKPRSK